MAQINLHQTMAYIHYYARKLGWQMWLGASLLLLSLVIFLVFVLPKQTALKRLENNANKVVATKTTPMPEAKQDISQLFHSSLPNGNDANSKVTALLQFAEQNQLTVTQAQYTQKIIAEAHMRTIQIKLPVQGSYVQIRQFITQALNNLPTIALDTVRFEREDLTSELLDANLQFTLYTQNTTTLNTVALKGSI